jgi:anti-anti-sigma factor
MHVVTDSVSATGRVLVTGIAGGALRVEGRLDRRSVAEVREAVDTALERGQGDLLLDLTDVEIADAAGLGLLVGAHRRAQRLGRRLVLRGISPRLARLLLATRLHRVLHLESAIDREAALFVTA